MICLGIYLKMSKFHIIYAKSFKKSAKRLSQADLQSTKDIINRLANGEILEPKYKDHALRGNYKDFRECHIKPDLLLLYQIKKPYLYLVRLGSHSELFKK